MNRRRRSIVAAVVAAILFGGMLSVSAQVAMGSAPATASRNGIALADGSALAMPAGSANGGGTLTITNRGTEPDRLVALSSPSSREVEVHETTTDGSTARTRTLPAPLEIRPQQSVKLEPQGSLRLTFVGVSQPFAEGSEVAVTLTFEKAGKIALKLPVLDPTAKAASSRQ